MEKSDGTTEFSLAEVMRKAQEDENGPGQRAQLIRKILGEHGVTNWDAYCFAVEYVAAMSLILTHTEPEARSLIRLLYLTHYVRMEDVEWLSQTSVSDALSPKTPEKSQDTTTPGL